MPVLELEASLDQLRAGEAPSPLPPAVSLELEPADDVEVVDGVIVGDQWT